ncbi:MAG: SDR family oxidoreductase [Halieaceae bacterium]|jgi:NAD(P)-dependent dehydrogenase (short-subunit alcohol dehydrogenase family)|nr:SDR family oxidoreductase [Halieaceae bacterium]
MASDKAQPVVLITGASSGLGQACAEHLAVNGFRVYGTSRGADYASINEFAMVPMDVTDDASVQAAVDYVVEQAGTIDIVVNNAGYGISGAIEDTSLEESRALFETNFFGVHRVCRAVIPLMRKQGRGHIINIGSLGGVVTIPFQAFYSATKSALAGLSDGLSMELAPFGIRVTRIEPGDYQTGFTANRVWTDESGSGSVYRERSQRAVSIMEHDEQNGAEASELAGKLLQIVQMKRPDLVYREGMLGQTLGVILLAWLPNRWAQQIIMKMYKV